MQKEATDFEEKYRKRKKIKERLNGWIIWENIQRLEEGTNEDIHKELLRITLKKVQTAYKESSFYKNIPSLHDGQTVQMSKGLEESKIPKSKTALIHNFPKKWTILSNYRSMTCLPMIWKILSAKIREYIYLLLEGHREFPEQQIPQGEKEDQVTYCILICPWCGLIKKKPKTSSIRGLH